MYALRSFCIRSWLRPGIVPCPSLLAALTIAVGSVLLNVAPAAGQEKGYEEWLQQQHQEYKQFLSEQDKAFLKFLKKEWTSVRVDTTAVSPIDNKPRRIPLVDDPPPETPQAGESPQKEPPREQPSPPATDRPFPEADSTVEMNPPVKAGEPQPSDDSDSSLRESGTQVPDDMEEVTGELETIEDEQQEPPSESPSPKNPPPENPSPREEAETATLNREASLSFFGVSTTVPYGSASTPILEGAPDKSSIRRFWKTMGTGPYRPTLDVLQKQREELGLSDWGYYLYLKDLGAQIYDDASSNERILWTWFMMIKSGYAARVGYRGSEVLLMLPVDQKIFGHPQIYIDGQRYYLMVESMNGSLRTYKEQHAEANGVLRLDEGSPPALEATPKRRTVAFTFQDKRYKLEVAYNPATVDYLRAYPNVELEVLMGAGVSSEAQASFKEALQPLVTDRPPRASMNLLLKFAQFATDYKRDQDHFGEERYLFPEESLATDYSDCEDRAVLLAYLTRTLLDREVVGLKWSRHVALAVRAGDGLAVIEDDRTVTVHGEAYIIADPTYIGSSLGMEMPIIENQSPEIITLGH